MWVNEIYEYNYVYHVLWTLCTYYIQYTKYHDVTIDFRGSWHAGIVPQ
jgi:hypothetical protein